MIQLISLDYVIQGLDRKIAVLIISDKYEELTDLLINKYQRGVTLLHAEGGYTSNKKKIIMAIINTKMYPAIKESILDMDDKAFMFSYSVSEVLGEGFTVKELRQELAIKEFKIKRFSKNKAYLATKLGDAVIDKKEVKYLNQGDKVRAYLYHDLNNILKATCDFPYKINAIYDLKATNIDKKGVYFQMPNKNHIFMPFIERTYSCLLYTSPSTRDV